MDLHRFSNIGTGNGVLPDLLDENIIFPSYNAKTPPGRNPQISAPSRLRTKMSAYHSYSSEIYDTLDDVDYAIRSEEITEPDKDRCNLFRALFLSIDRNSRAKNRSGISIFTVGLLEIKKKAGLLIAKS